jgi:hypothetical protein
LQEGHTALVYARADAETYRVRQELRLDRRVPPVGRGTLTIAPYRMIYTIRYATRPHSSSSVLARSQVRR